jgi:hypothetical protein
MGRLYGIALVILVVILVVPVSPVAGRRTPRAVSGAIVVARGKSSTTRLISIPADSLAPPGARHNWLPDEGWAWMHWLPFEEPELAAALGTDAAGIRSYLSDDRRVLAVLARRHGWRVGPLARYLTRRFDGRVTRSRLADLRWRTERVLTQGHLAQHVLFHSFHGPAIPAHAEQLFGISRRAFVAARQAGLAPSDLALREGRSSTTVRAGVLGILTGEADEGVRTGSESRAQSKRMLARQRRYLGCWMASPLPKFDPNNPFGGPNGNPGSASGASRPAATPGCAGMDMTTA